MAKKTTAVTKVKPNDALAVPDYMADDRSGTEELAQYVVPPRIKIVQKQSDNELLDLFGEGTVICSPQNIVVAEMGTNTQGRPVVDDAKPFFFVPVFFFTEYCTWNPLEMKGQLPAIRERSFDPDSDIAKKARNADTRMETCSENDKYQIRHVEHLNFVVVIVDDEALSETPMILTFARGEHGSGRNLAGLVRMRKAPLYGCVFEATVAARSNQMGEWYGLNVTNPATRSGWVEQEQFDALQAVHEEFKKLHHDMLVRPDYDAGGDAGEDKSDDF